MQTSKITRRTFLKGMCVGAGGVVGGNLFAKSANNKEQLLRDFAISFQHNMHFETPNTLELWLPLASIESFQTPYNLKVQGNYSNYQIAKTNGTSLLHATWKDGVQDRLLAVNSNVKIEFQKNTIKLAEAREYKKIDTLNEKRIADLGITKITHSLYSQGDSNLQKAQKLFAWVTNNISSTEAIDTQGIRTIYTKNGDAIMRGDNISAACVFASMCNIAGIPAIEAFGISFDEGRYNLYPQNTTYHSRSAIYINNTWIPNDVTLAIYAKETKQFNIAQEAFSEWDNNWILLNLKRDIQIQDTLLSTFQRVYGEIDGTKLSSFDSSHFQSNIFA